MRQLILRLKRIFMSQDEIEDLALGNYFLVVREDGLTTEEVRLDWKFIYCGMAPINMRPVVPANSTEIKRIKDPVLF